MNKKLTSIVWTISKENLQKIIDESSSFAEILPKLGLGRYSSGSYINLKDRIKNDNIDLTKFNINKKNNPCYKNMVSNVIKNKIPLKNILKENSTYQNKVELKKRLIKENILINKCSICGNLGQWEGKKLNLQLDHINGINNDNRKENLRLLCPNCHSQTGNFCGKNRLKKEKHCKNCGCIVFKRSVICKECHLKNIEKTRKLNITKDELQKMIHKFNWCEIAKLYNVSEAAVRKLAKKYQLQKQ